MLTVDQCCTVADIVSQFCPLFHIVLKGSAAEQCWTYLCPRPSKALVERGLSSLEEKQEVRPVRNRSVLHHCTLDFTLLYTVMYDAVQLLA